jgi:hypothetical protein
MRITIPDSFRSAPTQIYKVSQNSRIPNSERGREGPSGARKILRKKKFALPEEHTGVPELAPQRKQACADDKSDSKLTKLTLRVCST